MIFIIDNDFSYVFNSILIISNQFYRGTVYRDMQEDDPDFPEEARTDPPPPVFDASSTLQRAVSTMSIDEPPAAPSNDHSAQNMSLSDESKSLDWADQMQLDSEERLKAQENHSKY